MLCGLWHHGCLIVGGDAGRFAPKGRQGSLSSASIGHGPGDAHSLLVRQLLLHNHGGMIDVIIRGGLCPGTCAYLVRTEGLVSSNSSATDGD